jgi:hypothetical protein
MKRNLIAIVILMVSIGMFAKEPVTDVDRLDLVSVEGLVSDELSGESLTGVKVKLEGLDIVEYTDFYGKFRIDNLKPGKYTLLIEYISYDSKKLERISLDNQSDRNLDIQLQPSTIKINANTN